MRKLDFISRSPNLSIFRNGSNKTNLGGALYFIYILILIFLAIIYIFNYIAQEKYEFNYNLVKQSAKDIVELEMERAQKKLKIRRKFRIQIHPRQG